MVCFWFQWFTKPTLTQHPSGESEHQTHTNTHTHFPQRCNPASHTHIYTLHTAWRTAVFGPDAVFWLSLIRSNTTSCALQTFNQYWLNIILKGTVHRERNILSFSSKPIWIPSSIEHKRQCLEVCPSCSFSKSYMTKILSANLFHDNNNIFAKKSYFCLNTFVLTSF